MGHHIHLPLSGILDRLPSQVCQVDDILSIVETQKQLMF